MPDRPDANEPLVPHDRVAWRAGRALHRLVMLRALGLAPQPGADYGDLARRTVSLCGQILLKAAAAGIPQADRHVARMYAG